MKLALRTRVTLVAGVLMAAILGVTGVAVVVRLEDELLQPVDEGLQEWGSAIVLELERSGPGFPLPAPPAELDDDSWAQILAPGGGGSDLVNADELVGLDAARTFERTANFGGESHPARILVLPSDGGPVMVAASVEDQRDALRRLTALLWLGGPLALALAVLLIWVLVGRTLRPVEAMRAEAAAISASEPGRRLPVPETGDEIARLGDTLNEMLERLEYSIERERRLLDDASHELRTPLANLKAELELALRRSRSPEDLESALRSASEETDRMARLAEDLLVLARSDRGRLPVRRVPVDVGELVRRVVEPFGARAAERRVDLRVQAPVGLVAELDELRIAQALANLVDNGLRATPDNGQVVVEAGRADGGLRLEVRDTGPGFPPSFLPDAFEAFARSDDARTRPDGGAGLGLAIVRAVAEAHGGTADASNSSEGATVGLTIPAVT